jgi:hypothetical protein
VDTRCFTTPHIHANKETHLGTRLHFSTPSCQNDENPTMPVDTRHFTTPHVHSNFNFDGCRRFDTSLNLHLPAIFSQYTGRDVHYGAQPFELWSPNSLKLPVYSGTIPPGFSLMPPLTHCRTDGSGRRFDWTLIPQYLDTNRLHYPFILDPKLIQFPVPPEFTYLTHVWESSDFSQGRLT